MTDISALRPGQIITISDGRQGTVRFVGATAFAPGGWVGIELEDESGKNDGAVRGERYFECAMGRGMFVRPTNVSEIVEQPRSVERANGKANGKSANGTAEKGRPLSIVPAGAAKRQSLLGTTAAQKRMSMNAQSPTPGARGTGSGLRPTRSPTKSPTKEIASPVPSSRPSATARPSLGGAKARLSIGNRMSMGPPPLPASTNRTTRPSLAPSSRHSLAPSSRPPPVSPSNGHANRLSLNPTATTRPLSHQASDHGDGHTPLERQGEDEEEEDMVTPSSPLLVQDDHHTNAGRLLSQSPEATRSLISQKSDQRSGISSTLTQKSFGNSAASREVETLKSKLRLMEKKRMDDRERLKDLERTQAERDKFEGIIQKLQTKYQPQQQELADLRKQLKEAEARLDAVDRQEGEQESALEMATLDREMAEETAEAYKTELDSLKLRAEELELEVEVLREENQELGQTMSPEEKSTQGWLQMDRTNERLREALLRLRDLTQQTEGDLKAQVKELEDDLEELSGVKKEYEAVSHKFAQSEANVEDLRQQLDTALGAEEMIEELTERNLEYQEQVDNLKAAIEDLESLKELNDELELNHVEAEKQLQEEIDDRENLFSEQSRKVNQQDDVIVDLEYTLSRFRELVINLQSDLEDMRASQQISETEATELTSKSRAMIDLNMKLQASAARAQVKTIDMELRRLDAQEASDHLAMVQLFLPDTFSSERDPILALLRFKRIGFKANLLQGVVRERLNDPTSGQEHMFAAYDVIEKLSWISSTCNRFVNSIGGCDVNAFAKLEGALYELEPAERGLNGWIEGLKRNELNEKQCGVELQRSIALLTHLAETCMPSGLESFADDVHMRALLIQIYLENTAACLNHVKALTKSKVAASADEDESSYFGQRLDSLAMQARSSKVIAGKVVRSLEELKSSFLTPSEDSANSFHISEAATRQLSAYTRQIGEEMYLLLTEEGRTDPFTYNEVLSTMANTTSKFFETSGSDVDFISMFNSKLRSIASQLESLTSLATDLAKTQEFERHHSPWIVRAKELKATNTLSPDTEEEIRRLKASLQERSTAIGIRDNTLEENSIRIELLESRIREAKRRSTFLHELEVKLVAAQKKEKELSEAVETQRKEAEVVKHERDSYKRQVDERPRSMADSAANLPSPQDHAAFVAATKTVENLRLEITALQGTIRFLQDDNQRMKLSDPDLKDISINAWLNEPLIPRKSREQEQRRQKVKGECHDILNSLLKMTKEAKLVEIKAPTATKDGKSSIWMPMKERSKWQTAKTREEWEDWRQWRNEVVTRETGWEGRIASGSSIAAKQAGGPTKARGIGAKKVEIVT